MSESLSFDFYEDGFGSRYIARLSGHEAELRISRRGRSVWSLDHASIPRAIGGQWIGTALVAHAVQEARRSQRKLIPLCSFVRSQFHSHPEWRDVLPA